MNPRVVICGSFHRDHQGLERTFKELERTGCRILSPLAIDFTDITATVVQSPSESDISIELLELFHLRAIRSADFIWLFAPGGHVGTSAAYELGFAAALNVPVFCHELPADEMLQSRVHPVGSVFEALELL